ncbi:L,D-transpeptidase [Guyparkeria sp. 1SP6A2]|nr:L,D-transpeptidase [Guyparkeria sp. 1SP6A2]
MVELPPQVRQSAQRLAERARPGASSTGQSIVVDVGDQRLYLFEQGRLRAVYPVSTAQRGTGNREGSLQTPLGLHRVADKIGADAPLGMIFRGRRPTGKIAEILTGAEERAARDDVTSRILWLDGLEPGVNQGGEVDSKRRYIYIHGTPEEGRIGRPASHGCVRMTNTDVVELFDRVEEGALVDIIE